MLNYFPTDDLFEERAIILGKLGKHEKVLAIYIQILGDVDKAAAYCEEIYRKDHQNVNIYVTLIRTLLVPPTVPPYTGVALHPRCLQPNVDSVLELLKEHATKFNPHAVLQVNIVGLTKFDHLLNRTFPQIADPSRHHSHFISSHILGTGAEPSTRAEA